MTFYLNLFTDLIQHQKGQLVIGFSTRLSMLSCFVVIAGHQPNFTVEGKILLSSPTVNSCMGFMNYGRFNISKD